MRHIGRCPGKPLAAALPTMGRPDLILLGAIAVGIVIMIIRRPEALVRPQFLGEEGGAFFAATFALNPVETIATSWNGFIYLGPRVAFSLSRLVAPPDAPVATFAFLVLGLALTALFVGSGRMAVALPDARLRRFGALAVFLLPLAAGHYASVLQVTWYWAIYLAALLLATDPRSRAERWQDRAGAAAVALTGPPAIVMAPLYLAQRARRPDLAAIVCAGAAVQLLAFAFSPRRPPEGIDVVRIPLLLIERIGAQPLGDIVGEALFDLPHRLILIVTTPLLLAFAVAIRSLPRRTALVFGFVVIAIPIVGSFAVPTDDLRGGIGGARYFIPLAWFMLVAAAAALLAPRPIPFLGRLATAPALRRAPGLVLGVACIVGLAFSWQGWPFDDTDWERHAYCIGGPTPCVVPMTPTTWDVYWPGSTNDYRVPAASGPLGGPVYR